MLWRLLLVAAVLGLYACQKGGDQAETTGTDEMTEETDMAEVETGTEPEATEAMDPMVERSMNKDPGPADEVGIIETNKGTIVVKFFPEQAPLAVANFKGLAAKGYYEGVTFHRVISNPPFMMQGGDPTGTGSGGQSLWGNSFPDEFSPDLRFDRPGILAMANAGPNTNGSQFFITYAPTPHLNDKHTIFGEVIEGMDVAYEIGKVPTNPSNNKPTEPVVMESVTIESRP
jgi:cyclophilin family peptidyl-prolyl cis-trans isomerase